MIDRPPSDEGVRGGRRKANVGGQAETHIELIYQAIAAVTLTNPLVLTDEIVRRIEVLKLRRVERDRGSSCARAANSKHQQMQHSYDHPAMENQK
jgi:hypothetical protein